MLIAKEQVVEKLKKVEDPELRIDVYTLGLIYDIEITPENAVNIKMTLTFPGCPYGPAMVEEVKQAAASLGAKEVHVEVVWDPPWKPPEDIVDLLGV